MKVKIPKAKPGVNRYWRELKPEEPIFCVGRNGARVWVDLEGGVFYWTGQEKAEAHRALSARESWTKRQIEKGAIDVEEA